MSSAAGSAPFSFTVQNTGTIADVLTVSTTPVSAPWSVINAPFAPAPLAAGATHVYNTGVSWTALDNSNLGQSGSVTWTVTCGENIPAVVFDNTPSALPVHGYALSFNGERTAEYGSQVGFAGSALGWVFGYLLTRGLASLEFKTPFSDYNHLPVLYSVKHYVLASAVALASSFLAGYFPARAAARLNPVDIIRGAT